MTASRCIRLLPFRLQWLTRAPMNSAIRLVQYTVALLEANLLLMPTIRLQAVHVLTLFLLANTSFLLTFQAFDCNFGLPRLYDLQFGIFLAING